MISGEALTTQDSGTANFLQHFLDGVLTDRDVATGEFVDEFGPGQAGDFSGFVLTNLALRVLMASGGQQQFPSEVVWRFAKRAVDIVGKIQSDDGHVLNPQKIIPRKSRGKERALRVR